MKKLFTITLLLLFAARAFAVGVDYLKNTGTSAAAICSDASDNLYTTGAVPFIKYDAQGTEQLRIDV